MSKAKHSPIRRCLVCRGSFEKRQMLRLIPDHAGRVFPDVRQKAQGRGAYLCMQQACIARFQDRHLQLAWRSKKLLTPQRYELLCLTKEVLQQVVQQSLHQLQSASDVVLGGDAVMQRLHNDHAPRVLLLQAEDAGQSVLRSIDHCLQKRVQQKIEDVVLNVASVDWLGGMLGRASVSVVAVEYSALAERLQYYLACLKPLKELGKT